MRIWGGIRRWSGVIAGGVVAIGGTIASLITALRVQQACAGVAAGLSSAATLVSQGATGLVTISSGITAAASSTAVTLSALGAQVLAAGSNATAVLSQLSTGAAQLGPQLQNVLGQAVVIPIDVAADIAIPLPPMGFPPTSPGVLTGTVHLAQNITIPLSQALPAGAVTLIEGVAEGGPAAAATLSSTGQAIGQLATQVSQLTTQLGGSLSAAGQVSAQVGGMASQVSGQMAGVSAVSEALPSICFGSSLALGIAITVLGAGVIGIIVYLCCQRRPDPANTLTDEEQAMEMLVTTAPAP
ncbi:MAG: hypothetical protein A3E83_03815 [Gammaproteobacteria bacterium RIFCSPHIGHO2_12_FULL_41_20]|nr:MAG: hypothetical protein A3E83_03815 [Gammaproteobacteria bacterium RIFCSPHIGHO2_12_FULL_41_20]